MQNVGFVLVIIKLLSKIGPFFLKLLKGAKAGKFILAGGSLAAYSYLFTWEFSIILIIAIVIHEYGHLTAMKQQGIKTKGIYLIPFFGGAAVSSESFKSFYKERYISIMGPVYGFLTMIPLYILYIYTNDVLWIGLISFVALLNLFNLLPINPLDGGRIIKSIAFSLNNYIGFTIVLLGMFLALYRIYYFEIYLLSIILIIGIFELFFEFLIYKKEQKKEDISISEKEFSLKYMKKMNLKYILFYSFLYLFISSLFIYIIFLCSNVDGADLALKLIMDK